MIVIQNVFFNPPSTAPITRDFMSKAYTHSQGHCFKRYFAAKGCAIAAIFFAAINAPLYIAKSPIDFLYHMTNFTRVDFFLGFRSLVYNLGYALRCLFIVAALVFLLAMSVILPFSLSIVSPKRNEDRTLPPHHIIATQRLMLEDLRRELAETRSQAIRNLQVEGLPNTDLP